MATISLWAGRRPERNASRWEVRERNWQGRLLYVVFRDRAEWTLHVSPVPETLPDLLSGNRYFKVLDGPWQAAGGPIDAKLIERLDEIRRLCLPFPSMGDKVLFPDVQTGEMTPGVVLEVAETRRGSVKASGKRISDGKTFWADKETLTPAPND